MDLVLTHSRDPKSFLKKKERRKEQLFSFSFLIYQRKILVRLLQTTKEFLFVILVYER